MRILVSPHLSWADKVDRLQQRFAPLSTEARYAEILTLGKHLPPFPEELKIEALLVPGCQSRLYLASRHEEGRLFFSATADALISAGLAALLIAVYEGESPETMLQNPPTFLTTLGIHASLSPSRSNGLAQIHLRMKKDALKFLIQK